MFISLVIHRAKLRLGISVLALLALMGTFARVKTSEAETNYSSTANQSSEHQVRALFRLLITSGVFGIAEPKHLFPVFSDTPLSPLIVTTGNLLQSLEPYVEKPTEKLFLFESSLAHGSRAETPPCEKVAPASSFTPPAKAKAGPPKPQIASLKHPKALGNAQTTMPTEGAAGKTAAPQQTQLVGLAADQNNIVLNRPVDYAFTRERYEDSVLSLLRRNKRYPQAARRNGIEGQALLRLRLAQTGEVVEHSLTKSSGSSLLDDEVLALVQRSAPFPPFPHDLNESAAHLGGTIEFVVPIRFSLTQLPAP